MTDKEKIMIDGVNVSSCLFHEVDINRNNICELNYMSASGYNICYKCSDNPNCYYKQKVRKEQECEQIKEKYEALKLENQEGYEIVDELKHECEELKSKNSILKKSLKPFQDEYFKNLETIVIAGLAKKSIRITAENTQLREALEEIEELVKSLNENRMCFYDDVNDCSNCDMNTDCNYLRKFKILDIISKAKNEVK